MALLRLYVTQSTLNVARKLKFNNSPVQFHRGNHTLCAKRLINLLHPTHPKLFTHSPGFPTFRLSAALEHTLQLSNSTDVSQKNDNISQTVTSNEIPNGVEINNSNVIPQDKISAVDVDGLPPIPTTEILTDFDEPTLRSLGLGGWSPSGIVQQLLECFHLTFDAPWWAAIVGLTVIVRLTLLPFFIYMRRDMVRYQNNMPEFQHLQMKLTDARRGGNYFEIAQCAQELSEYLKHKKLFGWGMVIPYCVQFPVFLSVIYGLRNMANAPELSSFQNGGLFWFTDLSVPDQYLILPLLTSVTVWATLKVGSEVVLPMKSASQINYQKLITIGFPVISFLFTMKFSSAMLCYWITSNVITLIQTFLFKIKAVKKLLKIPSVIQSPAHVELKKKDGGIVKGFKNSYKNMSIAYEVQERERLNAVKFSDSGAEPLRRTFKYDPTKPRPASVLRKTKMDGNK